MGKIFTVDTHELEVVAKKLKGHSEVYADIYKQLLQEANGMADAWKGEDNLKFVEQINGFCQELEKMTEKLRVASETLDKIETNYDERKQANIAAVSKLKN